MTKKEEILLNELIGKIIDLAPEYEHFGTEDGDTDEDHLPIYFDSDFFDKFKDARIASGISKMVIILPELPFVVKIPYAGIYAYDYEDEYEEYDCHNRYGDYDEEGEGHFKFFRYDYCAKEIDDYERAVNACPEAENFLLPSEFYTEINGYKFYLQEKVKGYNSIIEDDLDAKTSRRRTLVDKLLHKKDIYLNSTWGALAISFFGTKKFMSFVDTLYVSQHSIFADLHCGNLGIRANGAPCILDFADFCD